MAAPGLAVLQTEQRNAKTTHIDSVSTFALCEIINDQDLGVAQAVRACLPDISKAIDLVVSRLALGGRVIYMGAGTSGRLGVLDASEIPPTFSAPPSQFVGLIAGGDRALRFAVEGAEDSESQAIEDLSNLPVPISSHDVVIGIASSGRTPYVLGGLRHARAVGSATVGIACVQPSQMRGACEVLIECVTGPEVITGSTRLKAGTATKMILNMISTGSQIKVGKTYGNLMVDLQMTNEKLRDRARRVLRSIVPASTKYDMAQDVILDEILQSCDGKLKLAILVVKSECSVEEGRAMLAEHDGVLSKAFQSATSSESS